MITKDGNSIIFTSKTFHWCPFDFSSRLRAWRGFVEQNNIRITDTDIIVSYSKDCKCEFSLPIKKLEYCINEKRIFNLRTPGFCMGNTKVSIGIGKDNNNYNENVYGDFKGGNVTFDSFYIDFDEYADFIDTIKSKEPLCFSQETEILETRPAWWRVDKLLNGNRSTLWMNTKHIISSEDVEDEWCVKTNEIKYFFTRGIINNNLYVGSEKNIRISNVTNDDVKTARQFIKKHGGNITEEADECYRDCWTPSVIFTPKLWFAHSSIGFTDKGIVYHQKTFKTNDDLFLPYEKINLATYRGKWYWLFTRRFAIYGEQNVVPAKRYSKGSVYEIKEKLDAVGVNDIEGNAYDPSYHTSWIGILLCIVTLSLYHWLVVLIKMFQNRAQIIIGEDKMAWEGPINRFADFHRKKQKRLTTLVLTGKDIRDVIYIKKHWYHLWGYLYIWARPDNIRISEGEAGNNQDFLDLELEFNKVWSWDAGSIISELEAMGFESNGEDHKIFKECCETYIS